MFCFHSSTYTGLTQAPEVSFPEPRCRFCKLPREFTTRADQGLADFREGSGCGSRRPVGVGRPGFLRHFSHGSNVGIEF